METPTKECGRQGSSMAKANTSGETVMFLRDIFGLTRGRERGLSSIRMVRGYRATGATMCERRNVVFFQSVFLSWQISPDIYFCFKCVFESVQNEQSVPDYLPFFPDFILNISVAFVQ